ALKDNPNPIPVTDSDLSNISLSNSNNFLPKFETFSDHTEETRSDSTTTHANYSLPEYDSFLFEIEPDQGRLISIDVSNNSNNTLLKLPEFESFHFHNPSFLRPPPEPPDIKICLHFEPDVPVINNLIQGEVRLFFSKILKMTIPSHLSFGLFSRFSPTPRPHLYLAPPGVKTPSLSPESSPFHFLI
ncbi:hypothetical protein Tco_0036202, partial [Tanacetum coccineum]